MSSELCEKCKNTLDGLSGDGKHATRVDNAHPSCACENYSVGETSPGKIEPNEYIYRMVISPGDIDDDGQLLLVALRDVKADGLSVFRDCASDQDIVDLVSDRLSRHPDKPTKIVQALLRAEVSQIRALQNEELGRLFCVYDETVPRRDAKQPRVPTHATVLQRLYPAERANRKTEITNVQKALFSLIKDLKVPIGEFRSGLLVSLNERSLAGDFIIQNKAA